MHSNRALVRRIKRQVLSSGYLQVDESPIKVLDSDKPGSTHQGYQWVYHSPERRLVLFDYRKGRGMHGPKEYWKTIMGGFNAMAMAYMIKLQH
ncbi:MAG: transposase [Saprospiraceae bacterium]|nr:transposase [Saprospiraceae bacterium]